MAFATIDMTKGITGTIPVTNGGTGLTSGTTDQFLKFTGTTTLASAADNAGDLVHLNTTTSTSATSTVSINDVFTSTYKTYKLFGTVLFGTDTANLQMQYTKANGGTVGTADSYNWLISADQLNAGSAEGGSQGEKYTYAQLNYNMDADTTYAPFVFEMNFYDPLQSFASYQFFNGRITFYEANGKFCTGTIGGQYRENFNATGLKFTCSSGDITRYYFNLYGIKNSGA